MKHAFDYEWVGFAAGLALGSIIVWWQLTNAEKKEKLKDRPVYKPGDRATPPSDTFGKHVEVFNPSELKSSYNLMISSVTPRPIALVSSRCKKSGVDNVSPFSYFGAVAHDPPMVAIGFCRNGPNKIKKDSLENILESKEFAVNIMSEWYMDAANHTCGNFKPEVDEFLESGLTKAKCVEVEAPRVAEAAVSYECKLEHVYPVVNNEGSPTTEIVLAKIVRVHVDRYVLEENFDPTKPTVDTRKLRPLGRLGGNIFCTVGEMIDIPRPRV